MNRRGMTGAFISLGDFYANEEEKGGGRFY